MKKVSIGFSLALILALALTITAFAEAVTVSGTITAIDEAGGTFTLVLADATVYTVTPPAGFDWTSIAVGDSADVSGESDGAGNLAATSVTPTSTETTVTGVVQSIDYATCTFTILTAEGTTLTVSSPEGTDCSAILLGTNVQVTGTLNEDGTFTASGIVLVPTEVGEGTNHGFYCSNPDVLHPALSMVATANGFDYVTTLNWFCGATGAEDGGKTVLGVGEIKKLLDLSAASGQTPDAIIAMRQTMGWGQIKKLLAQGAETTVTETTTETTITGNGNGNGNGNGGNGDGKPPWAGGGGNGGNGHGHGNGKNK
jgi:hypothetical protein